MDIVSLRESAMKKKFKLKNEISVIVRKYKTLSPIELQKFVLQDFNKNLTPESITMFFKRNPAIKTELQGELSEQTQAQIEVTSDLFQNGNFAACASIRKWNIEKATLVSPDYQKGNVDAIKRVCQGIYFLKDKQTKVLTAYQIPDWNPKSPERLTLEQAKEYIA